MSLSVGQMDDLVLAFWLNFRHYQQRSYKIIIIHLTSTMKSILGNLQWIICDTIRDYRQPRWLSQVLSTCYMTFIRLVLKTGCVGNLHTLTMSDVQQLDIIRVFKEQVFHNKIQTIWKFRASKMKFCISGVTVILVAVFVSFRLSWKFIQLTCWISRLQP